MTLYPPADRYRLELASSQFDANTIVTTPTVNVLFTEEELLLLRNQIDRLLPIKLFAAT